MLLQFAHWYLNSKNRFHSWFSRIPSILTEANKNTIPKSIFLVKANKPSSLSSGAKVGVRNARPKYAAEKLINNPENALSQGFVKIFSTKLL